ncbi:DUF397 domain-containing protein [Streptomyces millisiae]|uniref:DUF397 domain-containing protein n=1 Tax=Streptomyces millisiae TaxID=3075542 RepID=A0ABU2LRV3_9ACTN|nr:DUF397 domain-containing protein [Streptomyces sp. DSM 44918]MDT0320320.1 DUF397 domain-containing protein [Streptomyces sp. DSM 44918]
MTRSTSTPRWRTSSHSNAGGNCVQLADLADGRIAVRDSKAPESGPISFERAPIAAWLKAAKAGALDRP